MISWQCHRTISARQKINLRPFVQHSNNCLSTYPTDQVTSGLLHPLWRYNQKSAEENPPAPENILGVAVKFRMVKRRRAKQNTSKRSPIKPIKSEPIDVETEASIQEVEDLRPSNLLADVLNDDCGFEGNPDSSSTQARVLRRTTQVNHSSTVEKKPEIGILNTDTVVSMLDAQSLRKKYGRPTKETLRSLMALDMIALNILSCLSTSTLGELFSTYESDELSRQFFYHCQLMPSRCREVFRSYGNENKAKAAIEKHLKEHIDEMVAENEGTDASFAAESVQARERRIANECSIEKQKVFVKLERLDALEMMECPSSSQLSNSGEWEPPAAGNKAKKKKKKAQGPAKSKFTKLSEKSQAQKTKNDRTDVENLGVLNDKHLSDEPEIQEPQPNHNELLFDTSLLISKNAEMLAKMEAELQMSKQPSLDHQYAVINRPVKIAVKYQDVSDDPDDIYSKESALKLYSLNNKHLWDTKDSEDSGSCKIDHDLASATYVIGARLKTGYMVSLHNPSVQILPSVRKIVQVPVVGEEVVIEKSRPIYLRDTEEVSTGCIVDSDSESETVTTTSLARPYPPMPKYQPEMGAKLIIPEEDINLPDAENDKESDLPEEWDLTNEDHRKRYAIKCMRELKQNRGMGSRNIVVCCKICEKQFTAVATLMYHYRSHANIKPFVCLLCDATFTRQHSLNYHMLIHNGASRFKCPDCGRAFRHPSHYKEHQRRHTGEQPYSCHVCGHRFKTRNSYKRHIWSKHPGENIKLQKKSSAKATSAKLPSSFSPNDSLTDSGEKDGLFDMGKNKNVAPGPMVTMQVDEDNPAVRLIAENGHILNPKQVKIVPLSLVGSGRPLPGNLPTNILRNKDGKPIVLTLAQAEAGLPNFKVISKQTVDMPSVQTSAKMNSQEEINEHQKSTVDKPKEFESSSIDSTENSRSNSLDINSTMVQEVNVTYDGEVGTAEAHSAQESDNTDKSESTIANVLNLNEANNPTMITNELESIQSEEDNDTSLLCLDG